MRNKEILALAVPAIVANITTPLLSLVDTAIVGHLGSAAFIGAVAVGGSIFSMLYWMFSFLRFGTSGLTAQAVGAGEDGERWLTLLRSLLISLCAGVVLIALQQPLGRLALYLMGVEGETYALAGQYFSILIYGAPAVLAQYALTGWFVGSQDTRTPMWVSLFINLTNIAGSLLLVYGLGMQIEGVACGTLIAQWAGALLALLLARPRIMPWQEVVEAGKLKRFFSVNVNIFLRTLCLIAVTTWFTRAGAEQGVDILAVNTLLLQFFIVFSYFMDGFAYAAEAICGKYYGAGNKAELRDSIHKILMWGLAMAGIFTLLYMVCGEIFMKLLTDDTAVIAAARPYRLWAVVVPLSGFLAFTWDGIAIGVTRTALMFQSMLGSTVLFFLLWFCLQSTLGNHALWLAFVSYLLSRGVLLSALCVKFEDLGPQK